MSGSGRRPSRLFFALLALACLLLLVFPAAALSIPTGGVITQAGTYELSDDSFVSGNDNIIDIRTSDVIFEGNGHLIKGVTPESVDIGVGIRVYNSSYVLSNVTIRNVRLSNLGVGISFGDTQNIVIQGVDMTEIFRAGIGGSSSSTGTTTISGNTISGNTTGDNTITSGIQLSIPTGSTTTGSITISGNTISGTTSMDGIALDMPGGSTTTGSITILDNTIITGGIVFYNYSGSTTGSITILDNTIITDGIALYNLDGSTTIRHNTITDANLPFSGQQGTFTFSDNTITRGDILFSGQQGTATFSDNTITGGFISIDPSGGTGSTTIHGNTMSGILFGTNHGFPGGSTGSPTGLTTISENILSDYGISLSGLNGPTTVNGNTINSDNTGISFNSDGDTGTTTIRDNILTDAGISCGPTSDRFGPPGESTGTTGSVIISGNTITRDVKGDGISVNPDGNEGTITVRDNILTDAGISCGSPTDSHGFPGDSISASTGSVTISDNTLTGHGISFSPSGDTGVTTISGNAITGNEDGDGILISPSGDTGITTISNNSLAGNENGIKFINSDKSTANGNTISGSSNAGILFYGAPSSGNIIYNNKFNNTANLISDAGSLGANSWNTPVTAGTNIMGGPSIGGNFWGRPDGAGFSQNQSDNNNDGFCDAPYTLGTDNIDNYPLYVRTLPVTTPTPAPSITAGFYAFGHVGQAPYSVRFLDQSAGSPTAWTWDFGDGSSSTEQNPTHVYTQTGAFNVALTASNDQANDTAIQYRCIIVNTVPVAAFTANQTAGSTPFSVQFTDQSSDANGYQWQFGDGTTSTDQNPIHTYMQAGSYTVTLVASAADYGSVSMQKPGYITVSDLSTVGFSANVTAGLSPLAVQFNESTTGSVPYFYWQFGDGSTSFDRNPVHVYTTAGRYSVSLYAIDSNGYQVKTVDDYINVTSPVTPTPNVTTTSTVTPIPTATGSLPEANFTVIPQGGAGSMGVLVTDTSVNATTIHFDLGDGTTTTYPNFQYTYWQAGTYTIKLTATNAAGSSVKTVEVTVPVTAPMPTITFPPIGGDRGWYTIHCNVDGATVLFDQTTKGTIADGILKFQVYTTGTPSRTYTVQMDGYTTVSGAITQYPGKDQNVDITVTLTPASGQTPYNGPHTIPGLLQAEDYDLGGEGVAYHDTTLGNEGGAYRHDDVDIEMLDTDNSPNVGWIRAGEWFSYTVNISNAGTYDAGFRVASSHAGSSVQVYVDGGTTPVATVTVPNTGDWPVFQTVSVPVTLPAGQHRLKLTFPTDYVNINWVSFALNGGV